MSAIAALYKRKTELLNFLGLCSRFVHNLSEILIEVTEERKAFVLGERRKKGFSGIKEALCLAPVLAYPQRSEYFIINMNASYFGISSVPLQVSEDK